MSFLKHTGILLVVFLLGQVIQLGLFALFAAVGPGKGGGSLPESAMGYFTLAGIGLLIPALLWRWRSVHKGWFLIFGVAIACHVAWMGMYHWFAEQGTGDAQITMSAIGVYTFLTILLMNLVFAVFRVTLFVRGRRKPGEATAS